MMPNESVGMLHAQGGEAVEEEVALETMREFQRELEEEAELTADPAEEFHPEAQVFKRLAETTGAEARDIFARERERIKAEGERLLARLEEREMPEPEPVEEHVFAGSYGVTRTPPYIYGHTWSKQSSGGQGFGDVDRQKGVVRARSEAVDGDGSTAQALAAVGGFIRPNVRNGYMDVRVSPSFKSEGHAYRVLAKARARTRIGLLVGKYRASNKRFAGNVIQKVDTIHRVRGGGAFTRKSSGHSFGGSTYVDDAHFYVPWVFIQSYAWNTGSGPFHHSAAVADPVATLPWIRLAIY